MSNHVKRFFAAVSALVSHGDIKQRLIKAFDDHLADLGDDELPRVIRPDFEKLRAAMTRVDPLNGEGRIKATVRKMSVYEADRCAHRILEIYSSLVKLDEELEVVVTPIVEEQPVVPPFLVKSG
jgi:hypothetical protein